MRTYYEPTGDGKFYHAGLDMKPVILDEPLPDATQSSRRLEAIAQIHRIESEMVTQFMARLNDLITDVTQNQNGELNTEIARMQLFLNMSVLLGCAAGQMLGAAPAAAHITMEMERRLPL